MILFLPMYNSAPRYGGGYAPRGEYEYDELDWNKAPPWAKYAAVNIIGGWNWWAEKPHWDWFIGVWGGDIRNEPALRYVTVYNRSVRKHSLHSRPVKEEQ